MRNIISGNYVARGTICRNRETFRAVFDGSIIRDIAHILNRHGFMTSSAGNGLLILLPFTPKQIFELYCTTAPREQVSTAGCACRDAKAQHSRNITYVRTHSRDFPQGSNQHLSYCGGMSAVHGLAEPYAIAYQLCPECSLNSCRHPNTLPRVWISIL